MRKCPQCGSTRAGPSHRGAFERWAALALARPYRCRKCNHRFWGPDLPAPTPTGLIAALAPLLLALAVVGFIAIYMVRLPYAREIEAPAGRSAGAFEPPRTEQREPAPATAAPAAAQRAFGGFRTVSFDDERVALEIRTGGPPPVHRLFFRARPARWVVDLPGDWTLGGATSAFLNHPRVKAVSAGRYGDGLRVVLELGPVRGGEPELEAIAEGLRVTFGPGR